jgi:predicted Zn-ribbon and HTH transcriptional regulator
MTTAKDVIIQILWQYSPPLTIEQIQEIAKTIVAKTSDQSKAELSKLDKEIQSFL